MASDPFLLEVDRARELGRRALNFRHQISFNAQHFVYRRSFVEKSGVKPFYQSPYPDYFACFVTFLTAQRILVVPSPEIIIGIAKRSFGFFLSNNKETEGLAQFHAGSVNVDALSGGSSRTRRALEHPGSAHTRNWLLASLFAKRALGKLCDVDIDLRRYGRIQTYELAVRAGTNPALHRTDFWRDIGTLGALKRSSRK
jgi:hypothetical protein